MMPEVAGELDRARGAVDFAGRSRHRRRFGLEHRL
jgi:hypothetical protein